MAPSKDNRESTVETCDVAHSIFPHVKAFYASLGSVHQQINPQCSRTAHPRRTALRPPAAALRGGSFLRWSDILRGFGRSGGRIDPWPFSN